MFRAAIIHAAQACDLHLSCDAAEACGTYLSYLSYLSHDAAEAISIICGIYTQVMQQLQLQAKSIGWLTVYGSLSGPKVTSLPYTNV